MGNTAPQKGEVMFWVPSSHEFWKESPKFSNDYREVSVMVDGEDLYRFQSNQLASAILIKDMQPQIQVNRWDVSAVTKLNWLDKGELIAGSFIAKEMGHSLGYRSFDTEDIDIYFKCKEDAMMFCTINFLNEANFRDLPNERMCIRFQRRSMKFNLIWGVDYSSPENLVSKFDIRACSMAYDPINKILWAVNGALHDVNKRQIVFNPIPRATSIQRLVKYTQKGFTIEKYQRLFFAELIRSDIYSKDIELTTGYEVKSPT